MKPQVEIYDTTLRDGSQGEGINFSVADKLRIAEKLDSFGVHYIEGGWPGSNPKDIEFFAQAKKRKFKNAKLAAFGSTRKKNTPVEQDDQVRLLIEAGTPVVTIYGKTSMLHVKEVLRCTPEENLAMIGDTVRFLKDHGKFVIYDAEHAFDGFKLDSDYALATWQAAEKAGRGFCRVVRHERRLSAERNRCHHKNCARQIELQNRHPHARRHRPRRRERFGCARSWRGSCARHDQRLRRAHGQLQSHERDSVRRVEVEKNFRAGEIVGEAQGTFRVRGRSREHAAQSAIAVGRRGGVRA